MSEEFKKQHLVLSEFVLKILGIVLMTLDHIGFFLCSYSTDSAAYQTGYLFRILGRIAFPLFVFMLAEGIRNTHNLKKYLLRLGGLYLAITGFETLMVYAFPNRFFSPDGLDPEPFTDLFFLALVLACLRLKGPKKLLAILPIAFLCISFGCGVYDHFYEDNIILWFPRYLRAGYSLLGLGLALCFFYAPSLVKLIYGQRLVENKIDPDLFLKTSMGRKAINLLSVGLLLTIIVLFWGISYITPGREISPETDMSLETYALFSGLILAFYSGERGYDSKPFRIFTYLYFPVHIAILFLLFSLA